MDQPAAEASSSPEHDSLGRSPSTAARYFRRTLLAIALAGLVLQAAALGPLRNQLWGFHLYAFLPRAVAVGAWILTAAGAAWLLRGHAGGRNGKAVLAGLSDLVARRPLTVYAVLALAAGACFWLLRSQQTLLGNAWVLIDGLTRGEHLHEREPLSLLAQHLLYRGLVRFSAGTHAAVDVARNAVALGSVLSGVVFAVVAFALGRSVGRDASDSEPVPTRSLAGSIALLTGLVLLTQGYSQLFFGYVENYAYYALFVALYLWCGLAFLQARSPLAAPVAAMVVGIGVHLSMIVLLPSLVFLAACALRDPERRTGALRDLVLGAAGVLLLDRMLRPLLFGRSLGSALVDIVRLARADQGGGSGVAYMLSWPHVRDFVNEHYLTGPLGIWLFLPALGLMMARRKQLSACAVFLTICAATYLIGCWTASEPAPGYARDWHIFAPAGVACTLAGLHAMVTLVKSDDHRIRLLLFAVLVSAIHLGAWVEVNSSESRSLARVETLPLSRGRREVILGGWSLRQRDNEAAAEWFRRALVIDPGNVNALNLLGHIHLEAGDAGEAAALFGRAAAGRPDKLEFQDSLLQALLAAGRFEQALERTDHLCDLYPERYRGWMARGIALARLDRRQEAATALARADSLAQEQPQWSPSSYELAFDRGMILAHLGERRRAAEFFARALEVQPGSDGALWNLILMLMADERRAEVRPYLERFVRDFPEHAMRDRATGWLQELDGGE